MNYNLATNVFRLINADGSYQPALTPGGSGTDTLSGICSVAASDVSVTGSGRTLALTVKVNFNASWDYATTIFMGVSEGNNGNTQVGTWKTGP